MGDYIANYPSMISRGQSPISVIPINGSYLLGVYPGSISKYDILLRYRQKIGDVWGNLRTPKHIHWAVDVMIKHYFEPGETDKLIDYLIGVWDNTSPIVTQRDLGSILNVEELLADVNKESSRYPKLADKGEYSVMFLILIAKLLMIQEKTNRHDAFMFRRLLEQLRAHKDIFKIVSTATFNHR